MKLTYRVDGETIITIQPSSPREERSRFALAPDGTLMVELGGIRGVFRRGEKKAPRHHEDDPGAIRATAESW